MSKLETVRGLGDSAPESELVKLMRMLELLLKEVLAQPQAVSPEVMEVFHQQMQEMVAACERMAYSQRLSLDALGEQTVSRVGVEFTEQAQQLRQVVQELQSCMAKLRPVIDQVNHLPQQLRSASQALREAENDIRPMWWIRLLEFIFVALFSLVVTTLGQESLKRLIPPSEQVSELQVYRAMMNRATPKEQKLILRIANRSKRPVK